MGYVPSEYDKYFNFGLLDLIDYSNFGVNIEPPSPPPIPQNSDIGSENVENSNIEEVRITDTTNIPEQHTEDEGQVVENESDVDMNYNFDIVTYNLDSECNNVDISNEKTIEQPIPEERRNSTDSNDSHSEEFVDQVSDFDKIPNEVCLLKNSIDYLKRYENY